MSDDIEMDGLDRLIRDSMSLDKEAQHPSPKYSQNILDEITLLHLAKQEKENRRKIISFIILGILGYFMVGILLYWTWRIGFITALVPQEIQLWIIGILELFDSSMIPLALTTVFALLVRRSVVLFSLLGHCDNKGHSLPKII